MRDVRSWLLCCLHCAVACGSPSKGVHGADAVADATDVEVTAPPAYYAVIVAEGGAPYCGNGCSHGADIDAVALSDSEDNLLAWLSEVQGIVPTDDCDGKGENCYPDIEEARGPSDGEFNSGFVSLGGGFIIGEFEGRPRIQQDHVLTVFEVGSQVYSGDTPQIDEPYEVYLAPDLSCSGPGQPCALFLGDGLGKMGFILQGALI